MAVVPAADSDTYSGDVVTVRALGLSVSQTAFGPSYTFGYIRATDARLRDCGAAAFPGCAGHPAKAAAWRRGFDLAVDRSLANDGRGYTGFVNLHAPAPGDPAAPAGHVVDVTTIGLSSVPTPIERNLSLGYARIAAAALTDDVYVRGEPRDIAANLNAGQHSRNRQVR